MTDDDTDTDRFPDKYSVDRTPANQEVARDQTKAPGEHTTEYPGDEQSQRDLTEPTNPPPVYGFGDEGEASPTTPRPDPSRMATPREADESLRGGDKREVESTGTTPTPPIDGATVLLTLGVLALIGYLVVVSAGSEGAVLPPSLTALIWLLASVVAVRILGPTIGLDLLDEFAEGRQSGRRRRR